METATSSKDINKTNTLEIKLSPLKRICKIKETKNVQARIALMSDCDKVLENLKLTKNMKLNRFEVKTIIEILGLELSNYQKGELNILINKSHCFNRQALKQWILNNMNFVPCKYIGRSIDFTIGKKSQPIRIRYPIKRSLSKSFNDINLPKIKNPINNNITPLGRSNKILKRNLSISKKIENTFNHGTKEFDYCSKVRERFNKYMKDQDTMFTKNDRLLEIMKEQCKKMKHFQRLLSNC